MTLSLHQHGWRWTLELAWASGVCGPAFRVERHSNGAELATTIRALRCGPLFAFLTRQPSVW